MLQEGTFRYRGGGCAPVHYMKEQMFGMIGSDPKDKWIDVSEEKKELSVQLARNTRGCKSSTKIMKKV